MAGGPDSRVLVFKLLVCILAHDAQIAMDKRPFESDDPRNIGAWTPGIWQMRWKGIANVSVYSNAIGQNPGWQTSTILYNETSNWSHMNVTLQAEHFVPQLNFLQFKVRLLKMLLVASAY